jgi:hypothetical protein
MIRVGIHLRKVTALDSHVGCATYESIRKYCYSIRRTSVIDLRLLFLRVRSFKLQIGPHKMSRSLLTNVLR